MRRHICFTLSVFAVLATLALAGSSPLMVRASAAATEKGAAGLGTRVSEFRLKDDSGKTRTLAEFKDRKALVLVFIGTSCPVANSYAETLAEMARRYAPRGAQFLGVNANPDENLKAVAA